MFSLDKSPEKVAAIEAALVHLHCHLDPSGRELHQMKEVELPADTFVHTPTIVRATRTIYDKKNGGLPHTGQYRFVLENRIDPINLTASATVCAGWEICRGHFGVVPGGILMDMCSHVMGDLINTIKTLEGIEGKILVNLKKHGNGEFMGKIRPGTHLTCSLRWLRPRKGEEEGPFIRSVRHYGIMALSYKGKVVYATALSGLGTTPDGKAFIKV